jgi:hypothetical protein
MKFEHRYRCNYLGGGNLGYEVLFRFYGVPAVYLEWCQDNCPDRFGWHFETESIFEHEGSSIADHAAYITFEHQEDLVIFKLRHLKG